MVTTVRVHVSTSVCEKPLDTFDEGSLCSNIYKHNIYMDISKETSGQFQTRTVSRPSATMIVLT